MSDSLTSTGKQCLADVLELIFSCIQGIDKIKDEVGQHQGRLDVAQEGATLEVLFRQLRKLQSLLLQIESVRFLFPRMSSFFYSRFLSSIVHCTVF